MNKISNPNKAGLLANFPGLVAANMPQDCYVFFDDFLGSSISETAEVSKWLASPISGQSVHGCTILDVSDAASMDECGGWLVMATEATTLDGNCLQVNGAAFIIKPGYPLYLETRFAVADVSHSQIFIGLCIPSTDILANAEDDYIGYQSKLGVASFVSREGDSEKLTTITALSDKTTGTIGNVHRFAMYYDGVDTIYIYQDIADDGTFVLVATRTKSTAAHYVPENVGLSPSIELCNHASTGTIETLYVDYILVAQSRYKAENAA